MSGFYLARYWLPVDPFVAASCASSQRLNCRQARDQVEANNIALSIAQLAVDELCAQETQAFSRPDHTVTAIPDQFNRLWPGPCRPVESLLSLVSSSYPQDRNGKRELSLQSAKQGKGLNVTQCAGPRTISFAYQNGGGSLVDFLNAQNDYCGTRLNSFHLMGACLATVNQVNFAVRREAIR